jgi:hypothetical protein
VVKRTSRRELIFHHVIIGNFLEEMIGKRESYQLHPFVAGAQSYARYSLLLRLVRRLTSLPEEPPRGLEWPPLEPHGPFEVEGPSTAWARAKGDHSCR